MERRTHPRVKGPFEASWYSAEGVVPGRVWDLSDEGCFVESLAARHCGEHLRLLLRLPDEGTLPLSVEVLYNEPPTGFAVRFIDVPADMRASLERAMASAVLTGGRIS